MTMGLQYPTRFENRDPRSMVPVPAAPATETDVLFGTRAASSLNLPNIPAILRRRWLLLLACCVAGLVVALAYIGLATVLFTSTASILIDTRMNQNLKSQNLTDDTPVDTSVVDSQTKVLGSDSIALDVIRKLNLAQDSEFAGAPSGRGAWLIYQLTLFASQVSESLGLRDPAVVDATTLLERQALVAFSKKLTVKRAELSNVIDVSFDSESPVKAAQIVNEVTSAYIAADLAAKLKSTRSANQWLQDRLVELKAQATDADHQLQQYKARNNIVETGRGLLDQQALSDLNTQIATARAAEAEAKARLDRMTDIIAKGTPDLTVADVLSSNVITRLRAQYLDLAGRKADLVRTLGGNHQSVQKLQSQLDDLTRSIVGEEQRIAASYRSEYEISKARAASLDASLAQMVSQSEATNQAQVKARDLESSADAYRNIYNSFLQKFQETEQAQTIPLNDSRVVTVGQVPLKKSSPKTLLAIAGGLVLGLLVGGGLAVASELAADGYRSGADVEQDLGLRCLGILPDLSDQASRSDRRRGYDLDPDLNEWVLSAPYSRFAETVRNIYVSVRNSRLDQQAKVIGIVSSVPKEGKTTVAANLGAMVASLGKRTLVIDGDMHERSLSKALAPQASGGLLEAIADPERLGEFVTTRARSQLEVLPCATSERLFNAAEVLGSPQMERLLAVARARYDFIIIEFAPIVSVVDVKAAGHLVDAFVFVVKWAESQRKLIHEALSSNETVRERVVGVVLNRGDPNALRSQEAYRGKTFLSYYQD